MQFHAHEQRVPGTSQPPVIHAAERAPRRATLSAVTAVRVRPLIGMSGRVPRLTPAS